MPGACGTGHANHAGGVHLIENKEHLMGDILEPIFWGFIVALISLPFYLFMAVPQIGQNFNVGTAHAFAIPIIMAFLASALMGEKDMMTSLIMIISSSVFLTLMMLIVLLLPQITGVVYFLDYYYIDIAKKMMMAFIMFFPGLLIGGVTGKVFGDAFVSDISRAQRKELNEEMREWKETLERAIRESERGNVSEKEAEEGEKGPEDDEKAGTESAEEAPVAKD